MIIEFNGRTVFDSWGIKRAVRNWFCRHNWKTYSVYGLGEIAYEQEILMRSCRKCRAIQFLGYGRKVPFAVYPTPHPTQPTQPTVKRLH